MGWFSPSHILIITHPLQKTTTWWTLYKVAQLYHMYIDIIQLIVYNKSNKQRELGHSTEKSSTPLPRNFISVELLLVCTTKLQRVCNTFLLTIALQFLLFNVCNYP